MSLKKLTSRLFIGAISAIFLLLTCTSPVLAETTLQSSIPKMSSNARKNHVEWRYRTYNGIQQKRLWSITYQKWLTDWLPA